MRSYRKGNHSGASVQIRKRLMSSPQLPNRITATPSPAASVPSTGRRLPQSRRARDINKTSKAKPHSAPPPPPLLLPRRRRAVKAERRSIRRLSYSQAVRA
jgi:hypothetical protein